MAAAARTAKTASTRTTVAKPRVRTPKTETYRVIARPGSREIQIRDEPVFKLVEEMGALVMMDLALTGDDMTSDVEKVRIIHDFIDGAVIEEDVARFHTFLRRARPPILMDELNKVVQGLMEAISGRPTD